MRESENQVDDVRKQIRADDDVLTEARARRQEVLRIAGNFPGVLATYNSGSVAMGVVNDPVADADAGIILDRRSYPHLGPDGDGGTPAGVVSDLHDHLGPEIRETWPAAKVRDMKRGVTVQMSSPLANDQDPYVDLVVAMNRASGQGLWVPNINSKRWDPSDPQRHVKLMTSGSQSLRRTRAWVVRLAKGWNKQYSAPALNSFNIVALSLESITVAAPVDKALSTFFEHAVSSLQTRRTEDPAGVSGAIKLEEPKDVALFRLRQARDHVSDAIDAGDDAEAVAVSLHGVFWKYLPEPVITSKAQLADRLRSGTPRLRGASGLGVAGAVTAKRSYGDPR